MGIAAYPVFESRDEFKTRRGDIEFWRPHILGTLAEHGLPIPDDEPIPGFNSTYPTFICGEVVVKFLGYLDAWRQSFRFERAALELVATDPEILAPRLLGFGHLADDPESGWAYLITARVPGTVIWRLHPDESRLDWVAVSLGHQIRKFHPLRSDDVATHTDWNPVDVTTGARKSSLPPHLAEQAEDFVQRLGPPDPAFINVDIVANHIYLHNERLSGIIDWGDALIGDRHIELIQIYRDLFDCDKRLFRIFLDASEWPVTADFPRKALGYGLHRQALMIVQHQGGGDVFEPIAAKYPLDRFATLDELAETLFDVWS